MLDESNKLLAVKMQVGEAEYSARWPTFHAFIEEELLTVERNPDYKKPEGDAGALDRFLENVVLSGSTVP